MGSIVVEASKKNTYKSVGNDVLDFIDITATSGQIYNRPRKWRKKWVHVCKDRDVEGLTWCKESTALMLDENKYLMITRSIISS